MSYIFRHAISHISHTWVWFSWFLNLSLKSGLQDYHHEPIFRSWSHPALCDIFLLQKTCCADLHWEAKWASWKWWGLQTKNIDTGLWTKYPMRPKLRIISWECLPGLEEFFHIVCQALTPESLPCLLVAIVHAPHLRITILASAPNPLVSFGFYGSTVPEGFCRLWKLWNVALANFKWIGEMVFISQSKTTNAKALSVAPAPNSPIPCSPSISQSWGTRDLKMSRWRVKWKQSKESKLSIISQPSKLNNYSIYRLSKLSIYANQID